jgi:ATP-dependent DNA helicase RecG
MDTLWHRRLIYEELLMLQLVVLRRKAESSGDPGIAFEPGQSAGDIAEKAFDFGFTDAQSRCLAEIEADLLQASPMNRLLQGDVGSGKTAVALTAAILAAKAGYQTALMAPTELLAEQHARTVLKVLPELGVRVGLLTGKLSAAERRRILEELELGMVDVVVGTHALIQGSVRFKKLGLGIVDEQHRFGVMQRARFLEQGMESTGAVPHMLVMTATPIPRTLALTVYGDLDVSIIDQLPPGRKPVFTKKFREAERERVYKQVITAVEAGQQAYIVLPLVEESDKEGMEHIRDATGTHDELAHGLLHNLRVGLLHGKMGTDEKDRVMRAFIDGLLDVLVATTVIEVGIDVPNASVMVIEHAERFGLSQLHQLRGRVGRGAAKSSCLLIARSTQSEDAWRRLAIMEETTDGFKIAEEDLEIRGPGDFVGTRQSGLPVLSIANLARDQKILLLARDDAREILERDPDLLDDDHRGVRASLDAVWQDRLSLAKIG